MEEIKQIDTCGFHLLYRYDAPWHWPVHQMCGLTVRDAKFVGNVIRDHLHYNHLAVKSMYVVSYDVYHQSKRTDANDMFGCVVEFSENHDVFAEHVAQYIGLPAGGEHCLRFFRDNGPDSYSLDEALDNMIKNVSKDGYTYQPDDVITVYGRSFQDVHKGQPEMCADGLHEKVKALQTKNDRLQKENEWLRSNREKTDCYLRGMTGYIKDLEAERDYYKGQKN